MKFHRFFNLNRKKAKVRATSHFLVSTDIAIDSTDRAHIAYSYDGDDTLNYTWFDGSTWQHETIHDYGSGDGFGTVSLALDSAGRPHIAHHNAIGGWVDYWWSEGGAWLWEPVVIGNAFSLALDAAGVPHMGYANPGNGLWYASRSGS